MAERDYRPLRRTSVPPNGYATLDQRPGHPRGLRFSSDENDRAVNAYTRMTGARLPTLQVPAGISARQFLEIQNCCGD